MKDYTKHSNYMSCISREGRKENKGLYLSKNNLDLEKFPKIRVLKIKKGYEGKL